MSAKLLTDVQVAERFGIDVETFHKLRRRHSWPCTKIGRSVYRFTEAQVEAIVAQQTHVHTPREKPAAPQLVRVQAPGQTPRSAARRRQIGRPA